MKMITKHTCCQNKLDKLMKNIHYLFGMWQIIIDYYFYKLNQKIKQCKNNF